MTTKQGKIKILDFGLATYTDEPEVIFTKILIKGRIAAEVLKYNTYDTSCNVFSADCVCKHYS